MKHAKEIVGQKIVKVDHYDDYMIATLKNGMEIEVVDITSKTMAEKIRKQVEKIEKRANLSHGKD